MRIALLAKACTHSKGLSKAALFECTKSDVGVSQNILCTSTDSNANQGVSFFLMEKCGESTVPRTIAVEYMGFFNSTIFCGIDFELAGVTEIFGNTLECGILYGIQTNRKA